MHNCGGKAIDAALDSTGKVHGKLPEVKDLKQYDIEELQRLQSELKISIQTRIDATVRLGADYGYSARISAEQKLLKSI